MRRLEVKNFSCIDSATLEIADLTVIIGPQASGKSVLCKLFYFFNSFLEQLPRWLVESDGKEEISTRIVEEFSEFFQPSSWGTKSFVVSYKTGPFQIQISRARTKPKVSLSDSMQDVIDAAYFAYRKAEEVRPSREPFENTWRKQEAVRATVTKFLGKFDPEDQLYIPAGRSFFTSVGKIVTAFDDRSMLDPVVTRFGRFITSIREHGFLDSMPKASLLRTIESLIDGEIVNERGKQYLSTTDGRNIPFSALSSGQQELLPLLHALRFAVAYGRERKYLLYVEEPEAHLFPSAQTALVEMFAQMVNGRKAPTGKSPHSGRMRVILTTHSPYVLAKINNLIKAGSLAGKLPIDRRKELDKIIPVSSWLNPDRVAAYAISGKKLIGIVDEFGLIDGDYIDEVSSRTGFEFESMLEMEASLEA